ncbi:TPA: hypothetical protein ACJ2PT_005450, partial [Klebsiella pneumoniae]
CSDQSLRCNSSFPSPSHLREWLLVKGKAVPFDALFELVTRKKKPAERGGLKLAFQGATVRARLIVRATDLPGCICFYRYVL